MKRKRKREIERKESWRLTDDHVTASISTGTTIPSFQQKNSYTWFENKSSKRYKFNIYKFILTLAFIRQSFNLGF